MNKLLIPAGKVTPGVAFEEDSRELSIDGQSFPENPRVFYQPVFDWVRGYLSGDPGEFLVILHILYLNTSSVSAFLALFELLEEAAGAGWKVGVEWLFDQENEWALEVGEDLQAEVKVPFVLKDTAGGLQ